MGGASTSTSSRNAQIKVDILAERLYDSWNSFEPLTNEEIETYLKDNFVSNINKKSPERLLPIPGIVQPALERKKRSAQRTESSAPSASVLSRVTEYLNDDLDTLEDDLESSDNQVIMYMNNRVDTIMDTVQGAMEHSG